VNPDHPGSLGLSPAAALEDVSQPGPILESERVHTSRVVPPGTLTQEAEGSENAEPRVPRTDHLPE